MLARGWTGRRGLMARVAATLPAVIEISERVRFLVFVVR